MGTILDWFRPEIELFFRTFLVANSRWHKYFLLFQGLVWCPASIDDPDDGLGGEWGVKNQNNNAILEYVFNKYEFV